LSVTDAFTLADDAALCDGYLIYTFPAGSIVINSCSMEVGVQSTHDSGNATAEIGVGTVEGSDAQATLGADDAGCEDVCGPLGSVTTSGALSDIVSASSRIFQDADADRLLYVNVAGTWGADGGADLTADLLGFVTINWTFLGNPA
jgi:hypothetical protein